MTGRIKVLVVDDEFIVRESLVAWFKKSGYDVDGADGGHRALELLVERDYDFVFLDIKMPDMSGVDVLRRMRALKGSDFGVIMLSGHAYTDLALEAMRAGANDFLLKPCEVDVLLERIDLLNDRILEQRHS